MATINIGLGRTQASAEAVHAGINAAVCHISLSISLSAGDVHNIGKLPQGAIPLDAVFYAGAATPAGFVSKFGTSASQELFFISATYSLQVNRTIIAQGYRRQISLSDDARALNDNITMVATAGCSIGHVGDLVVYYKMPGQTP